MVCHPKAQVGAIAVMTHHVGMVYLIAVGPDYVVFVLRNHGHKVGVGRYARTTKLIAYRMAA